MEYLILILLSAFVIFVMYIIYKNTKRKFHISEENSITQPPQTGPYQWVYNDNVGFQENTARYHECEMTPKYPDKPCTMDNIGEVVELDPCFEDEDIVLNPYWKCEKVEDN
jgi:hypothetical protein